MLKERDVNVILNDLLAKEETFLRKKLRIKSIVNGDRCTRFFFLSTMIRKHKNFIDYVKDDNGVWLDNKEDIASTLSVKFKSLFVSQDIDYPIDLKGLPLPIVDPALFPSRLAIPTNVKIKEVLFSMNPSNTPGLDRMLGLFFCAYWEIVQEDVVLAVREFFLTGCLLPKLNEKNIVLVSKVECHTKLNDYMPISL